MFTQPVRYMTRWGMIGGTVSGLIIGALMAPFGGALYGYVFGFVLGTIISTINGLLIHAINQVTPWPTASIDNYRLIVGSGSFLCTSVLTWLALSILFVFGAPLLALTAAVAAGWGAHHASQRYIDARLLKRKRLAYVEVRTRHSSYFD